MGRRRGATHGSHKSPGKSQRSCQTGPHNGMPTPFSHFPSGPQTRESKKTMESADLDGSLGGKQSLVGAGPDKWHLQELIHIGSIISFVQAACHVVWGAGLNQSVNPLVLLGSSFQLSIQAVQSRGKSKDCFGI